jgi:penicillin-binding protein 1A
LRLRYAQGASTITQQLARILLQNRQKSILRKVQEIRLARTLESILPKQKILELYVNHVYLGHGNYSFASAAKFYYDKPVSELTPAEFLSLVALIPSPEKYSPLRNNRLLQRRMEALWQAMEKAGKAPVTRQEYLAGLPSVVAQGERFASETAFGEKSRTGLWPALYARDFLLQRRLLSGKNQNSARIYTTIDASLQQRAEELVAKHLKAARRNFRGVIKSADAKERKLLQKLRAVTYDNGLLLDLAGLPLRSEALDELQAALIALNPRTGEILAMVGGESFESNNQLNRTIQMRRQTGSAIKPFIYAKALSQHLIHPATLIDDTPYVVGSGPKMWSPENINGRFEGPIPVRDALAKSRNIPAIRVGRLLGREGVTELFSEFFFQSEQALESRFAYDETVAIGTISLSPLEMARAFSVFANGGFLIDPSLVTRVETPEKVIDLRKTHPDQMGLAPAGKERLLSAAEAQLMVSLLKSSGKNAGTGVAGIIGKTGTSSESRDLWFVGGGKEIIVAVWFGYDDMRISIPGATGSALAARLAGDFLKSDFAPVEFKMQPGMVRLRVCPLSGRLASQSCRHARSEVFLNGVIPEGECLHGVADDQAEFMAVMGDSQFR